MSYSRLDSQRIIETIARLGDRIRERFPAAGLGAVANELLQLARTNAERSATIRKPNWWLRAISVSLLARYASKRSRPRPRLARSASRMLIKRRWRAITSRSRRFS